MSYQALARRWRPQSFDQMVGQEHVLRALVNALGTNRLHHAYLLTGTRGVGKTTLARLLAKGFNCEQGVSATPCGECSACREISEGRFVDLIEVDAASRTKVEDTRELLENVQYTPTRGRFKVYLIDEVHMLSTSSFNALLKTLEEPPDHVKFLLATTDPQKLPATVLSRCLQFHLRNLSPEQISTHLARVLGEDAVPFDDAALMDIALAAEGSVRDALSLTDQAIAYGGGEVRAVAVAEMLGHVNRELMYALTEALLAADAQAVLVAIDALAREGADFDRALVELLGQLHRVALAISVPSTLDAVQPDVAQLRRWSAMARPEDVQLYYQIGILCRRDMPYAPDPRSGLEMALLRMLAFRPQGVGDAASAAPGHAPRPASSAAATAPSGVGDGAKKPEPAPAAPAVRTPRMEPARASVERTPAPVVAEPVVAEPAAAEAADTGGTVALPVRPADIRPDNWADLLALLDLHGVPRSVAANSVPERAQADALALVLQEGHEMLLGPQSAERIAAALAAHFGSPVNVSLRVGLCEAETPAARASRFARERQLQAERSIESDPNVLMLQREFGGRLHRGSIRPRDVMH